MTLMTINGLSIMLLFCLLAIAKVGIDQRTLLMQSINNKINQSIGDQCLIFNMYINEKCIYFTLLWLLSPRRPSLYKGARWVRNHQQKPTASLHSTAGGYANKSLSETGYIHLKKLILFQMTRMYEIKHNQRSNCVVTYNNIWLCSLAGYKKNDILRSCSEEYRDYEQLKNTIWHISCLFRTVPKWSINQWKNSLSLRNCFLERNSVGLQDLAKLGQWDVCWGYDALRTRGPAVSHSF